MRLRLNVVADLESSQYAKDEFGRGRDQLDNDTC